ncbi:MAG TPA: GrpB family protein [Acidimicrobiales bacterium]|nr:GrpB family protein [Acidimicrobiales bacterium]
MNIFRFDAGASGPVSRSGSRFKLRGLATVGAQARVSVIYLAGGDLIGRHNAPAAQLFAVVAGAGWVSGREESRRGLGPGYAALWDEGEPHEAGAEEGMTAICIEGAFDVQALAVTKDIVVSDYNPDWARWFEQIRDYVWPAVRDLAIRLDHVGSTSVPGLAAKPIIDVDIVVAGPDDVAPVIERLGGIGYRWQGDLGVPGRQAFAPAGHVELPEHHLYLVVKDNRAHLDHWLLRDLLRADPAAREAYSAVKRQNVELARGDMDVYLALKGGLIAGLLKRAREERGLPPVTYWDPGA